MTEFLKNFFTQVKVAKDTMPDSSNSIMSGLSMNMSDIYSNDDTMSISSRINISGGSSKMDYGRQKKKYEKNYFFAAHKLIIL